MTSTEPETFEDAFAQLEAEVDDWWEAIKDDALSVWEMSGDELRLMVGQKAILERYREDKEDEDVA